MSRAAEEQVPITYPGKAARRTLARVIVLEDEGKKVVWRVLAMMTGWSASCACGRTIHQWCGEGMRPSHVQCPACRKWTVAP